MARYIDADKLVEDLRLSYCKGCNSYNGIRCRSCEVDDAMDYIDDAPTADVAEVKHGEWKYPHYFPNGGSYIMKGCTVCGYTPRYGGDENPYTNYCPNCGAKMDGVREENE